MKIAGSQPQQGRAVPGAGLAGGKKVGHRVGVVLQGIIALPDPEQEVKPLRVEGRRRLEGLAGFLVIARLVQAASQPIMIIGLLGLQPRRGLELPQGAGQHLLFEQIETHPKRPGMVRFHRHVAAGKQGLAARPALDLFQRLGIRDGVGISTGWANQDILCAYQGRLKTQRGMHQVQRPVILAAGHGVSEHGIRLGDGLRHFLGAPQIGVIPGVLQQSAVGPLEDRLGGLAVHLKDLVMGFTAAPAHGEGSFDGPVKAAHPCRESRGDFHN